MVSAADCEGGIGSFLAQPSNAISSVSYLVAAASHVGFRAMYRSILVGSDCT
jgi:hypothetical protein